MEEGDLRLLKVRNPSRTSGPRRLGLFNLTVPGQEFYILGGWQLAPIFQTQTGQAQTPTLSGNLANAGGGTARPDVIGDPNENAPHTPEEWFSTFVFFVPITSAEPRATYTFGNAGA